MNLLKNYWVSTSYFWLSTICQELGIERLIKHGSCTYKSWQCSCQLDPNLNLRVQGFTLLQLLAPMIMSWIQFKVRDLPNTNFTTSFFQLTKT